MKCRQMTTLLSYDTVLKPSGVFGLAYRTMCTIKQELYTVLVYHTLLITLLFLHVNIYYV